jgi:pre-mRNA cleavage complex 2 protein Pcf11
MADSHPSRLPYGTPSDEVAEDYRKALEDLTMNSRYEISNLTVIAKENTEHALAISEALKNHIKQTSPAKKLPAFYVLDSVVKNVGTPYTLFFGRQLYSTFMEAYALVDNNVRRKMDEMLKTWKEPVPGSIDTRPVFPPEVTRPIENALIKARTSAVQAHQEHLRSQQQLMGRPRPSPTPYRDTPTPPGTLRQPMPGPPGYPPSYGAQQYPPPMTGQQYPNQMNGQQQYGLPQVSACPYHCFVLLLSSDKRPPNQQYPVPPGSATSWQQPQNQGYHATETSIDTLTSDIANLIAASKADFAQTPWDSSIQTRLKALLDLQTILSSQKLPPDQIALIKDQVAQLSEASKPQSRIQTPPAHVLPPAPVAVAPPNTQQPSLSSILGPGALAALLASQSATPQPTPPTQAQSLAPVRSPQPSRAQPSYSHLAPSASTTPVPDPNSLLEKLRAAGMLPAVPVAKSAAPLPLGPMAASVPPGILPPFINTPPSAARTPLADIPNDVVLKPASLKM